MNFFVELGRERSNARALAHVQQLTIASLFWGLASIVVGTLLVAMNVPDSCTGWPLCGSAGDATSGPGGLLHVAHRLSGLLMIVTLGAATAYAYARTNPSGWLARLLTGAFALGLVHAVLGGVGTTLAFPAGMTAVHLILALVLCLMLLGSIVWLVPVPSTNDTTPTFDASLHAATALLISAVLVLSSATAVTFSQVFEIGRAGGAGVAMLLLATSALLTTIWLALGSSGRSALVARINLILIFGAGVALVVLQGFDLSSTVSALPPLLLIGAMFASTAVVLDRARGTLIPALERRQPLVDLNHVRASARDFLRVTKPGIMLLLLTTTFTSMLVAAQGWPGVSLVLWTLLGGALASGGASAMNCYLDRDIDGLMARTRKRPIPTGTLSGEQVRGFALILSFASVFVLATFVNPLAAGLALAGNLFYVGVYTQFLKRSTPQNIVIGGAAGSFPPLVGWAAVTGSLGIVPLLLAAIVFYWTPPHFWSLALLKGKDYRRAGIPMLPVSHGEPYTRRAILLYSFLLVAVTALVVPAGGAGMIYLIVAGALGLVFLSYAWRMYREESSRLAWRLFKFSNYYLAALLFALVIDRVIS